MPNDQFAEAISFRLMPFKETIVDHVCNMDDITENVREVLANPPTWETRDSAWTASINEHMKELGQSYGFSVGFPRKRRLKPGDSPGWLCDHHWQMAQTNPLIEVPLAMEIEWGFGNQKLLEKMPDALLRLMQCPAKLRVLTFALNDATPAADAGIMIRLKEAVRSFSGTKVGDRYLFCGWSHRAQKMFFSDWVVRASDLLDS